MDGMTINHIVSIDHGSFGHWATFCSSGTIGWEVWHSLDVENITVTARQLEPYIPFSRPPSLHQWGLGNLFFLSLQPSFSKVELRCFMVACLNHQFLCTNTLSQPHMHILCGRVAAAGRRWHVCVCLLPGRSRFNQWWHGGIPQCRTVKFSLDNFDRFDHAIASFWESQVFFNHDVSCH